MTTSLRFLGASGYEVVGPRFRILFDPFLRGNLVAPDTPDTIRAPDLILVSHGAWDHLGDAGEIAKRTGAIVASSADVIERLRADGLPEDQLRALIWGVCYAFGEIVVRPVECHHWSSVVMPDGRVASGVPLSFLVDTEPGVRIYHFGDTALFPGLRLIGELYRPTVGIIGCAQTDGLPDPGAGRVLTGEMNPDEAALAAEMLGIRHLIATHYLAPGPEVAELARRATARDSSGRRIVHAPAAGDTMSIEAEDAPLPSLAWGVTSDGWDDSYQPPLTGSGT